MVHAIERKRKVSSVSQSYPASPPTMALPDPEKDWRPSDPAAAANVDVTDEPVAETPLEDRDIEKARVTTAPADPEKAELRKVVSHAVSTATYSTTPPDSTPTPQKRSWSRTLNPLKSKHVPPVPTERGISREYTAGFFSRLTFQWMAPMMRTGYQRPLEVNDIWTVNPNRSVEHLATKLEASFKMRSKRGDKHPLVFALYDTLKFEFLLGGLCQLLSSCTQVVAPFALRFLIAFANDAWRARREGMPEPNLGRGIGLVFGILGLQIVQSLATNHFIYMGMMNGGQARAVLISVIFSKAMRLSGRAKAGGKAFEALPANIKPGSEEEKKWFKKIFKKTKGGKPDDQKGVSGDGMGWSNGRIINLMSTDTYRVDQAAGFFHMLVSIHCFHSFLNLTR